MARYLNQKRRRSNYDGVKGVLLGLVGFAVLGAFASASWWLKTTKVEINERCPVSGPRSVHVLIVDRSDPVSGQQAQRIRQEIATIKTEAKAGDRFDFYVFEGDSKNVLEPWLSVCSPGRPEDANRLYQNPGRVQRKFEEFASKIDATIGALVTQSVLPTSPIMESLRAAAQGSFGPIRDEAVPLRLTLVSDMIQNSALASQYREGSDFPNLASKPVWAQLRPNLKGAEVVILYLLRPDALRAGKTIQNTGHQLFWEQFISQSAGSLVRIEPI